MDKDRQTVPFEPDSLSYLEFMNVGKAKAQNRQKGISNRSVTKVRKMNVCELQSTCGKYRQLAVTTHRLKPYFLPEQFRTAQEKRD